MVQIGPLCPQCAKGQSDVSHRKCGFFSQTRLSSAEKGPQGTDATVTLTSGVIVVSAVDRCPVDHAVYPGPLSGLRPPLLLGQVTGLCGVWSLEGSWSVIGVSEPRASSSR